MTQLEIALYILIGISLVFNIYNLFKEAGALKKKGKTPLVGRNLVTTFLAAVGEVLVVWGIYTLYGHFNIAHAGTAASLVVFTITFLLQNIGAYVMAWLTWAIFVRRDKKKMLKELEQEGKL